MLVKYLTVIRSKLCVSLSQVHKIPKTNEKKKLRYLLPTYELKTLYWKKKLIKLWINVNVHWSILNTVYHNANYSSKRNILLPRTYSFRYAYWFASTPQSIRQWRQSAVIDLGGWSIFRLFIPVWKPMAMLGHIVVSNYRAGIVKSC